MKPITLKPILVALIEPSQFRRNFNYPVSIPISLYLMTSIFSAALSAYFLSNLGYIKLNLATAVIEIFVICGIIFAQIFILSKFPQTPEASLNQGNNSRYAAALWATLPFSLRHLARLIFMLVYQGPIFFPGLSGISGGTQPLIAGILRSIDIFLLYSVFLYIRFLPEDVSHGGYSMYATARNYIALLLLNGAMFSLLQWIDPYNFGFFSLP